jgi:hypothetical protein
MLLYRTPGLFVVQCILVFGACAQIIARFTMKRCPEGERLDRELGCLPCPANTYLLNTTEAPTECLPCPAGLN